MINEVKAIAKQAGNMMMQGYLSVEEKTDASNIVTDMDVKVQSYIIDELQKILPQSNIIAEESLHNVFQDGYTWIIDPIDGTMNYAYDYHHSAVSIALVKDGEGILGVCYNPYLDEIFYAEKGKGAYINNQRITVGKEKLSRALVVCGTAPYCKEKADTTFLNMKKLFLESRDIRRSGSAVLDICYVAAGRCDVFYEEQLSPWDYAAASIILQEAQGYIHALHAPWGFTDKLGMIAGNEEIVKEVQKLLEL